MLHGPPPFRSAFAVWVGDGGLSIIFRRTGPCRKGDDVEKAV